MKIKQRAHAAVADASLDWCKANNITVTIETGFVGTRGEDIEPNYRGRHMKWLTDKIEPEYRDEAMTAFAKHNPHLTTADELYDPPMILVFETMSDKRRYQEAITSIINKAINEDTAFDRAYQYVLAQHYAALGQGRDKAIFETDGQKMGFKENDKTLLRSLMHKKWNLVTLFEDRGMWD